MTISIIGGGGFLGSFVVEYLIKNTDKKLLVNIRNSELPFEVPANRVELVRGDISNIDVVKKLINSEIVIHLGQSLKPNSNFSLNEIFQQDLNPTLILLQELKIQNKKQHFIFISSGGTVYQEKVLNESFLETDTLNAISYYGANKIYIENIIKIITAECNFKTTILRLSNPYGKLVSSARKNNFIGRTISLIKENKPVEIFGGLNVVRDYIHLRDVADALLCVVRSKIDYKFDIFNLGYGKGYSLQDIVNIIQENITKKIDIRLLNSNDKFIQYNVLNISKFQKTFSWNPKIDLPSGIKDLIFNFNKELNVNSIEI